MTIPSPTPARNDVAEDLLAQDLLAQRPAVLAGPAPIAAAPRRRPSLTMILGGVVGAAVLFAGGLLVGHATGSSTTAQTGPGANGMPGGAGGYGATGGGIAAGGGSGSGGPGGFTSGEIASIDGSTLTITTSDGTTVTVTTSSDTTVSQTADADVSALAVGDTVTVVGQTADDSSVAAQAITEGSTGFGLPGGAQS
ncbi:hypothetical protein DDP54_05230 [Cellulomonas sp. WB94]|uniref:DUF5666 domain-containing protein n=1 Tax=Cellulomonas sp. WB94 TaxID=2173174 RepID=UPI000D58420D|nr:DUF5666 domain-containing protein [Cellulomonas sp. WB94]PVU82506.1 hypothetical protein DDP54_05230 [Cellulomonas sp. WB94]